MSTDTPIHGRPQNTTELRDGVLEVNGAYWGVKERTTCDCEKMYCRGCSHYYIWTKLSFGRVDCKLCGAKKSVEPTWKSGPTNDPKDNMVGVYEWSDWVPTCMQCGQWGRSVWARP
jgi:hypothetical protein